MDFCLNGGIPRFSFHCAVCSSARVVYLARGVCSNVVPEEWRFAYSLNPMTGVIDGFRWAILGGEQTVYLPGQIVSVFVVALLLVSGIWYFRRMERTFADVI